MRADAESRWRGVDAVRACVAQIAGAVIELRSLTGGTARAALLIVGAVASTGCGSEAPAPLVGSLEWDRVAVLAELSEPVLRWAVTEGQRVEAGEIVLELDARRQDARIASAESALAQAEARLMELTHGARIETIDAARANLARAKAAQIDAENDYLRIQELNARGVAADAARDQAAALQDQRRAEREAAEAQLRELTQGTRPEQIEQAAAAVAAARAAREELALTRERLTVRAPRAGIVDALPFRPGDQPPLGAELVSMLVGDAPYARVFVPTARRVGLMPGDRFEVRIDGLDRRYAARLRTVRSEASFTPYYALAGDDASRLVYRAELVLEGEDVAELPAGLPLTAEPVDGAVD